MVGLVWYEIQDSVIKILASVVLVVHLVQTSKPYGTLIIPDFVANNQPVTWPTGFYNNRKLSINKVGLCLASDHVCSK